MSAYALRRREDTLISPRRIPSVPGLRWEKAAWAAGKRYVAGVDEAGRGAWAGPLVAAAVGLPHEPRERASLTRAFRRAGIVPRDSKLLRPAQRDLAAAILQESGVPWSVHVVPACDIDTLGLAAANRQALTGAVAALTPEPDHILVDAFRLPELACSHDPLIKGDSISLAIALASIVAKTCRDRLMAQLCEEYPAYGFSVHKGYGTRMHHDALRRHGPSDQHRRSFEPVAALIEGNHVSLHD